VSGPGKASSIDHIGGFALRRPVPFRHALCQFRGDRASVRFYGIVYI